MEGLAKGHEEKENVGSLYPGNLPNPPHAKAFRG